jgi:hypothetical protein
MATPAPLSYRHLADSTKKSAPCPEPSTGGIVSRRYGFFDDIVKFATFVGAVN